MTMISKPSPVHPFSLVAKPAAAIVITLDDKDVARVHVWGETRCLADYARMRTCELFDDVYETEDVEDSPDVFLYDETDLEPELNAS